MFPRFLKCHGCFSRIGPVWSQFSFPEMFRVCSSFHAQYHWTTGVLDNGNEWRKFRVVPRLYPLRSLVCTLFNEGGNRRAFRLPGAGGGSFPLYGGTFARSYSVPILAEQITGMGLKGMNSSKNAIKITGPSLSRRKIQ